MHFEIQAGHFPVKLIADGDMCVLAAKREGAFEPETLARWVQLARGRVVDVGANTGVYSIAAAMSGAAVEAFEPHSPAAARLAENAKANGVVVNVHEMALLEKDGSVAFGFNPNVTLTSGGTCDASQHRQTTKRVPADTLDSFSFQNVTAVKIDVEGCEMRCLQGAIETIDRCHPAIISEALSMPAGREVEAFLGGYGYSLAAVLDGRNWLFERR